MASSQNDQASPSASVEHNGANGAMQGGLIAVFVQRPILALVISLLIIIAGSAALLGVEVRELPDVDRPVVSIRVEYPGATPDAIDAEVTSVIESAVALVEGVESISSSSQFGRSNVTVEFSNAVDINVAATDVQNAISGSRRGLPEGVEEPRVTKADNDGSPIMRLTVSAENISNAALADIVDDVILPRIQSVEGVAAADEYGLRRPLIRVRLLPVSLAARGLAVADVSTALAEVSQTAPSGRLRSDAQEILIRTESVATTPEEIADLRLTADTRLGDVAFVEWGVQDQTTTARVNGAPGVGIGVVRQAQSNTVAVADGVRDAIRELNNQLSGNIEIKVSSDDAVFIKRAIEEVVYSLGFATLIVTVIIFMFLGSARATIIPAVTIPISLLGTVAAIWLAGFSINLLTLLALVMATGLVVDDAIVVTENIQRWRGKGLGKRAAAIIGSREIVFAVLSTTATLAAVFIPISFLPGQAGQLFSEFGFVLAFAVLVSSFVALTLCPMLTVKLGRRTLSIEETKAQKKRDGLLTRAGKACASLYRRVLSLMLRFPAAPIIASLVFAVAAWGAYQATPQTLTPTEDRGRIFVFVRAPDGANFDYLDRKVAAIEDRLQTFVDEGVAENVVSITGVRGGRIAFVVLRLQDWRQRDISQSEVEGRVRRLLAEVPGVAAFARSGNSLGIRGAGQGLRFAIAGDDYEEAAAAGEILLEEIKKSGLFAQSRLDFSTSQPQVTVDVDREAAAMLGIPASNVAVTLNALADEFRAAQIFVGDDVIDVMLSASGDPVNDPTDLANVFLRARTGDFVPLSSIATVEEKAVAATLSREERRRAVPATASLVEGVVLGDAVNALRAAAKEHLPSGMSVILLGEAKLLETASESTMLVFGFAILIVFLVLAAQFESFISAVIIMVTVPFGLAAAVFAINLTGGSLNYYSQIGLVLLIGVMAKNGILIVEFANQLRDDGAPVREAVLEAAMVRLRPVSMTAISTLLGGVPLILGSGAGAESRAALGWVVVGGLGFATIFTLFLTPVAFLLLGGLSKPRAEEAERVATELKDAALVR